MTVLDFVLTGLALGMACGVLIGLVLGGVKKRGGCGSAGCGCQPGRLEKIEPHSQ